VALVVNSGCGGRARQALPKTSDALNSERPTKRSQENLRIDYPR